MTACILIDMDKLRIVKRAPTVHQLEYWAELLCKGRDFRIQGPQNRFFSVFSITELAQLYMNANGPSGTMRNYEDAINQLVAMVDRLPIDDTPLAALAKKLGYEIKSAQVPLPKSGMAVDMQAPPGVVGNTEEADASPVPTKGKRSKKVAPEAVAPKAKPVKEAVAPKVKREPADPSGRPASSSKTGQVWDIADKMTKVNPKLAKDLKELRGKVMDACGKAGINSSTAGVQFGKWKNA